MLRAVLSCSLFVAVSAVCQGGDWQHFLNSSETFITSYLEYHSITRVDFFYEEQSEFGAAVRAMTLRVSSSGLYAAATPINSSRPLSQQRRHYNNQPATAILISCHDHVTAHFLATQAQHQSSEVAPSSINWLLLLQNSAKLSGWQLGLRPDARFTLARFTAADERVELSSWNGVQFANNDTWRAGKILAPRPNPTLIRNLKGYHISVALFHDPPFVKISSDGNTSIVTGWFVDVWNELKSTLHFTSNFYEVKRKTNKMEKMRVAAEELASGRADVVLAPFAITSRNFEMAEFSLPLAVFKQRLFIHRSSAESGIGQFIKPFSNFLWLSVIGATTFSAFLMGAAYSVARKCGFELQQSPIFEFKESFLIIFSSLLQQGTDNSPNSASGRIILWCSYAFGVVIYTAYSAALISKLTVREVDFPFQTLDQMLFAANYKPLVLRDSTIHHLIKAAEAGSWRELRERKPGVMLVEDADEAIDQLMRSKDHLVLLEAHERIGPLIQDEPLNCELMVLPGKENMPVSLMLQKASPFKMALDQMILKMWEDGRLSRVRGRWLFLVDEDPCPLDASLPSFTLRNVALPFFIFISGIAASFAVLVIENLVHSARKK